MSERCSCPSVRHTRWFLCWFLTADLLASLNGRWCFPSIPFFFSFCELKLKDPTCFLYSNVCNMSGVLSCVLNPLETDHTVWRCTSVTGSTIKCSLSLVFSLQVFLHWLAWADVPTDVVRTMLPHSFCSYLHNTLSAITAFPGWFMSQYSATINKKKHQNNSLQTAA